MFYVLLCLFVVGDVGRLSQATQALQSLGQIDQRLVQFLEGDLQYADVVVSEGFLKQSDREIVLGLVKGVYEPENPEKFGGFVPLSYEDKVKTEMQYQKAFGIKESDWLAEKRLGQNILNAQLMDRLFGETDSRWAGFIEKWGELCQIYRSFAFVFHEQIVKFLRFPTAEFERTFAMAYSGNFYAMILKSYPTDPKSAVLFVEQYNKYQLKDTRILRPYFELFDGFFKLDATARLAFFQQSSEARIAAFYLFLRRVAYSFQRSQLEPYPNVYKAVIPIITGQFPATNPERINILAGNLNTPETSRSVDIIARIALQNLNTTSLDESSELGQCFNQIMDTLKRNLKNSKDMAEKDKTNERQHWYTYSIIDSYLAGAFLKQAHALVQTKRISLAAIPDYMAARIQEALNLTEYIGDGTGSFQLDDLKNLSDFFFFWDDKDPHPFDDSITLFDFHRRVQRVRLMLRWFQKNFHLYFE